MAGRPSGSSVAVLVVIAVGTVAGLLVTAAAITDDDDGSGGDDSSTTTTTAARRTTTSGTRAATSTTRPPTTRAPIATTVPPPPPPASPPAPGDYVYAETSGDESDERTYRVEERPPGEDEERAPGEVHFLVTLETEGGSVTTITSWQPEAVRALQTFFRTPEVEARCDWDPDLLQLNLPVEAGAAWSYATSCTADFESQEVRIAREGEVHVTRAERITVAGEEVDAWRIESKETTRFRGAFRRTDQEIRTWWFSPRHGLTVREHSRQRHTTPDGTTDEAVERELVELRPV